MFSVKLGDWENPQPSFISTSGSTNSGQRGNNITSQKFPGISHYLKE